MYVNTRLPYSLAALFSAANAGLEHGRLYLIGPNASFVRGNTNSRSQEWHILVVGCDREEQARLECRILPSQFTRILGTDRWEMNDFGKTNPACTLRVSYVKRLEDALLRDFKGEQPLDPIRQIAIATSLANQLNTYPNPLTGRYEKQDDNGKVLQHSDTFGVTIRENEDLPSLLQRFVDETCEKVDAGKWMVVVREKATSTVIYQDEYDIDEDADGEGEDDADESSPAQPAPPAPAPPVKTITRRYRWWNTVDSAAIQVDVPTTIANTREEIDFAFRALFKAGKQPLAGQPTKIVCLPERGDTLSSFFDAGAEPQYDIWVVTYPREGAGLSYGALIHSATIFAPRGTIGKEIQEVVPLLTLPQAQKGYQYVAASKPGTGDSIGFYCSINCTK